jgi:acyl transferase domain-containing protein/acyl carrier protein
VTPAIAIVGMSGRFPGAADVEAFWENLRAGISGITVLTPEELRAAGVAEAEIADPRYVRAVARLAGADLFDAPLFGLNPREAEVMDPQQRVFLECTWAALEDAGYDPERFPGWIGVYAGSGIGKYLWMNVARSPEALAAVGTFQAMISNDKDYLASQASYRLNLRGPSVGVQTACSTSLVAVHLACQALLCFECDLALAGGVALSLPADRGYLYQDDGISSPDGACRPFDARAGGTIRGNGVGIVVLKRLADAEADGDRVLAVIRGSAINNDGSGKVGYTAPSVSGQAEVIAAALAVAGVGAETIDYVEAHGTATRLGDPVEVAALTQAFDLPGRPGTCALGSVKSNVGHLDAAAGVAGLIKTVLALHHGELPPTLHYDTPNPQIDFASGPFYVHADRRPWPSAGRPRRAGVSAFGIGGTNAHVVLEEAPAWGAERPEAAFRRHLLPLSAGSETALAEMATRLARHLRAHPEIALADVAYTLQVGRRELGLRLAIVARSAEEAAERLEAVAAVRPVGETVAELPEAGAAVEAAVDDRLSRVIAADPETAESLLADLGRLWTRSAAIDWPRLHAGERRHRVPLPTYPFERRRYWIEAAGNTEDAEPERAPSVVRRPFAEWFYLPSWRRTLPPPRQSAESGGARCCLVLADDGGLGEALGAALRERGWEVVLAFVGDAWETLSPGRYRMRPGDVEDHARLWRELAAGPGLPRRVLHLWNVTAATAGEAKLDDLAAGLDRGFYSLLQLARTFGRHPGAATDLLVFSNRLHAIDGDDRPEPVQSALLGICRVLPQEQSDVRCRSVDLAFEPDAGVSPRLVEQCLAEIEGIAGTDGPAGAGEGTVAWRGPHRWVAAWNEVPPATAVTAGEGEEEELAELPGNGVYLITGGLGGVGLEVAALLARNGARLVLLGRRPFPERESWDGWIANHGDEDAVSGKIRRLRAFEALGAEIQTIAADVADPAQMAVAERRIRERFGAVDAVFHAAGIAGGGLLSTRAPEEAAAVLAPKVRGTQVLAQVFADARLLVLFSSLNALYGGIGQADYAAANAFLDGFAAAAQAGRGGRRTVAIHWDAWREVGMAAGTDVPEELAAWRDQQLAAAITPDEGRRALVRVLATGAVQIAVATDSLSRRLEEAAALRLSTALLASAAAPRRAGHPRPAAAPAYVAPETSFEARLAGLWEELLGISPIGRDDGFFDLGGHSLLAGQLTSRLRDEIGIELPLEAIFTYPTPALLAAALAELGVTAPTPAAPAAPPVAIKPLPRASRRILRTPEEVTDAPVASPGDRP